MKSTAVLVILTSHLFGCEAVGQRSIHNDPLVNFATFWRSYEADYPTFDLKQLDWKQQYVTYKDKIDSTTSEAQLFDILSSMIKPLNDAHVRLAIKGRKVFWPRRPSVYSNQFQFIRDSVQQYWNATNATLETIGFEPLKAIGGVYEDSSREFYYAKSTRYGYIRISQCTYGRGSSGAKLNELDSILVHFRTVQGVILDLRFNQGGGDRFAFGVAGRFVEKGRVGCYRYRRRKRGGYSDFVKLTTFRLRPKGKQRFTGKPVILLTNDRTVSAGDILALILHTSPNVTLVGENSEGSFDSFRFRQLPNGWSYSVPLKRYHDAENHCYEGTGVPVDVKVIANREDIRQGHDAVLLKAVTVL